MGSKYKKSLELSTKVMGIKNMIMGGSTLVMGTKNITMAVRTKVMGIKNIMMNSEKIKESVQA